ncbi:MAG: flagellar basal body L-ring protein FlgH [Hydrogenovibrio sp.]|uniref:flagellar basal body L-ring protein FlgH n=1 Tax=Hydrogenovibrio sp. TaxID=2065821 RepID=UPI00287096A1|nr:flagellar basal body L-ring protein FlgH [Hydrogenovibrio sp.]MDR9499353.1 flagellar basal body L-ring protein FlgH [Hydrogenovibrio sp.]
MTRKQMIQKMALVAATGWLLSGCSTTPERLEEFSYEPSFPVSAPQNDGPKNGSLYQSANSMSLFNDARAHRIGDIITIQLSESFDAQKKDQTTYEKSNQQDFGVNTPLSIFGQAVTSPITAPFAAGTPTGIGIGYGSNGAFDGSSNVKQNSDLTGSIAVTVVEVSPNGNLVVRGEKWITVHDGSEVIRFAGIIRPQDISMENTVASNKVADARVIYKDVGMSGDTNRPGVITKGLNKYWPF